MEDAFSQQVGGSHYKDLQIQPVDIFDIMNTPAMDAIAIRYVVRWRKKNGLEDLKKAKHSLALICEQGLGHESQMWDFLNQFEEDERLILLAIFEHRYGDAMDLVTRLIEQEEKTQD